MVHPSVYSRAQIVQAAFDLIRQQGWGAVTTRAIAKKMGSSTMPIYSHVRSVEELAKELRLKARASLKEYQERPYTEHALLNLAFGYVVFARDETMLFRFLFMEKPELIDLERDQGMGTSFLGEFGEHSEAGLALGELEAADQESLIKYTWIFTHGLAVLINSGTIGPSSDETILSFLKNAGEAFYLWGSKLRKA